MCIVPSVGLTCFTYKALRKECRRNQQSEGSGDDFQSALDEAVAKVLDAVRTRGEKTDPMISWKLVAVSGQRGGIASINSVTAKNEYDGGIPFGTD